jgi:hypothetical protein
VEEENGDIFKKTLPRVPSPSTRGNKPLPLVPSPSTRGRVSSPSARGRHSGT